MGYCHICYGSTPPKQQFCETCAMLCRSCKTRLRHRKSPRCLPCESEKHRERHGRRSPEELRRVTTRAKISQLIRRGKMTRTPCAECGAPGEMVHFPGEISVKGAIFLCKAHHREVRPLGRSNKGHDNADL